MFLIKIFHFLFGYDILSINGDNKEKILTLLSKKGVHLRDIKICQNELTAKILHFDSDKISDIPNCNIKETFGFPAILMRFKNRLGFWISFAVVIFAVIFGSQFIWTIDYDGAKDCNLEALENAVTLSGLKIGTPKTKLLKPQEMQNIILNHTDDICWCWVYVRGTKATVKVRKNVIPKSYIDLNAPCDIIAMRNGIIKKVVARKGQILVKDDQAVTAGETIISGTYEFEEEPGYQVHSIGKVEAYTEHIKSGEYKQFYCYKRYTGRKRRFLTIDFYKWKIPLYIKKRVNFSDYDETARKYGGYIGVGAEVRELAEYETKKEPISYEATVEFAKNELEKEITAEILEPATIIDKTCDVEKIDEDTIFVTVKMNFIEEIGTEKQIEEVNFIEPKTNQSATGD